MYTFQKAHLYKNIKIKIAIFSLLLGLTFHVVKDAPNIYLFVWPTKSHKFYLHRNCPPLSIMNPQNSFSLIFS